MYLVELKSDSDKEEVYHNVEQFTAAIRRGEVSSQSRIYHRAASMWIPVTLHPQFRKIAAELAAESTPPLLRTQWTFYRANPPDEPVPHEAGEDQPSSGDTATKAMPARSWRSMFGGLIGHSQS
jgi:hypothetical protein